MGNCSAVRQFGLRVRSWLGDYNQQCRYFYERIEFWFLYFVFMQFYAYFFVWKYNSFIEWIFLYFQFFISEASRSL